MCVWCMKEDDIKHGNPLGIIQQDNAWESFKEHTIHLQNPEMRKRILTLIDSTSDPFAAEI